MVTEQLLNFVKKREAFRSKAYWDKYGKVWTVGYGETKGVVRGSRMVEWEASVQLSRRLGDFQDGVKRRLGSAVAIVTQNQLDAMTSLAYNIGLGAFGRSTVLRKTRKAKFDEAADAFLMWKKSGGVVLKGLVRRRVAERAMYLS